MFQVPDIDFDSTDDNEDYTHNYTINEEDTPPYINIDKEAIVKEAEAQSILNNKTPILLTKLFYRGPFTLSCTCPAN